MICQCWLINCNKHITLVRDTDGEYVCVCVCVYEWSVWSEDIWEFSLLSAEFCSEPQALRSFQEQGLLIKKN